MHVPGGFGPPRPRSGVVIAVCSCPCTDEVRSSRPWSGANMLMASRHSRGAHVSPAGTGISLVAGGREGGCPPRVGSTRAIGRDRASRDPLWCGIAEVEAPADGPHALQRPPGSGRRPLLRVSNCRGALHHRRLTTWSTKSPSGSAWGGGTVSPVEGLYVARHRRHVLPTAWSRVRRRRATAAPALYVDSLVDVGPLRCPRRAGRLAGQRHPAAPGPSGFLHRVGQRHFSQVGVGRQ